MTAELLRTECANCGWNTDCYDDGEAYICADRDMCKILAECSEMRRQRDALAAWSCATCGARFPQSIRPALRAVLLDGVTQCSKCVEVEALTHRVLSLQAECERLRAAVEESK